MTHKLNVHVYPRAAVVQQAGLHVQKDSRQTAYVKFRFYLDRFQHSQI